MTDNTLTLVTGATGKTGSRVAAQLVERGLPVRAVARRTDVPFDWTNNSTWAPALDGVTGIYLVGPYAAADDTPALIAAFLAEAKASGAETVVFISTPESSSGDFTPSGAEDAVLQSGLTATVLRPRWFGQNFSEDFLFDPVVRGELRLNAGDGREAFIDADDIAEVAVTALTESGHGGKIYELAGPRALSFTEAAEALSEATGRDIRYVPVTFDQYVAEQVAEGVPADFAEAIGSVYTAIAEGEMDVLTSDVEKVLGRPPRDISVYISATAPTGVWNP